METHHDTAVPDVASPARFEGCREEGKMRYSARVRGTARLKIARYMEENADEGSLREGGSGEGGGGRSRREGPWRRHGLQARGARAREGAARGRTDPVDGTACGRAVRRGHLEKAWRGDAS
jgi:hypothetical protein